MVKKIKKEKEEPYKITATIYTNEELKRLDHKIEFDLDNIVNQITNAVLKEKETIFLQMVIEKQQKEIKKLKEDLKECVHKDTIKVKIGEYKKKCDECNFNKSGICKEFKAHYNCSIQSVLEILYELLGETI